MVEVASRMVGEPPRMVGLPALCFLSHFHISLLFKWWWKDRFEEELIREKLNEKATNWVEDLHFGERSVFVKMSDLDVKKQNRRKLY